MMDSSDSHTAVVNPNSSSEGLEDFLKGLTDSNALHSELDTWLEEGLSTKEDGHCVFDEPFKLEELYQFDHALDGLNFPEVLRMPSVLSSGPSETEACLAAEDFLYSAAQGLWNTFWCDDNIEFPFSVTSTNKLNYPRGGPYCAALVERCEERGDDVLWEHVSEILLLGDSIQAVPYGSFPAAAQVSQAVFYALQLLLSKKLSQLRSPTTTSNQNVSTVFVLIVHVQGGSVVKVEGDISKLETNTTRVYNSAAVWIQQDAQLMVSAIEKVWNKFGSVNWHDVGALQMVLATFCCMEQCRTPKKSIIDLSNQHRFRLLQRAEQRCLELGASSNKPVAASVSEIQEIEESQEIDGRSTIKLPMFSKIESGTVLWVEDSHESKGFEIHEDISNTGNFIYTAIALGDEAKRRLNVYIGAHPAQLEPSWEDMGTWYQVQRQTRVLNVMKQRELSSQYIPKLVLSGGLLHPGLCTKQAPKGHCDHPWCGVPVLVTSPVGESLQKIFTRDGNLPPRELLKCSHDCLSALQSAHLIGIEHANITPDHVVRVIEANGESYFVLVEWGHATLEEKDSPGTNWNFSSSEALQEGRTCPVSDVESLIYVLFYLCGGILPQFDSLESALHWRVRAWTRRAIQQVLGEVSIVLKAFADYVDNLCGTPYAVDYDIWLSRFNRLIDREESSRHQHD